jgi:hypothetical protein
MYLQDKVNVDSEQWMQVLLNVTLPTGNYSDRQVFNV